MNEAKYIGLDVHQATISVAVRDSDGKLVMVAILETKAETILQFVRGLRGSLHVTFEEGTCAAWLYALLKPHVTQVLVCDPRKNALEFYAALVAKGIKPEMARLTLARKIAAITLIVWKKGARFDAEQLKQQA